MAGAFIPIIHSHLNSHHFESHLAAHTMERSSQANQRIYSFTLLVCNENIIVKYSQIFESILKNSNTQHIFVSTVTMM